MISEQFNAFFSKWPEDKESATSAQTEYKLFNKNLKEGNVVGKTHPKDKKIFPLKSLDSAVILKNKIPSLLHSQCGLPTLRYKIQGSIGQGNPAEIPWICVFDLEITKSAQEGYYIVFLFNSNMSGVYLSLNQGWTQYEKEYGIKEGRTQIATNASKAKSLLRGDQGFSYATINLNATQSLGKGYEAGNICSKYYPANAFPNDNEIIDDLRNLIGVYRELKGLVGSDILVIKGKLDEEDFQKEVQKGKRNKLNDGKVNIKNKKESSSSSSWARDPNMSFTAIDNAGYKCEHDESHMTFISGVTGRQFVEAHHLIPMEYQDDFDPSIDVPENIISLCPNCHRAFHNSTNKIKENLINKFLLQRKNLLNQREITITPETLHKYYKID